MLAYDFGLYKGWVAENFVAQELTAAGYAPLHYWRGRASEVDFIVATPEGIVPVEVKAGTVTHSKSLAAYAAKFRPAQSVRLSGRNTIRTTGATLDLPLYLAGQLGRYLAGGGSGMKNDFTISGDAHSTKGRNHADEDPARPARADG